MIAWVVVSLALSILVSGVGVLWSAAAERLEKNEKVRLWARRLLLLTLADALALALERGIITGAGWARSAWRAVGWSLETVAWGVVIFVVVLFVAGQLGLHLGSLTDVLVGVVATIVWIVYRLLTLM